MDNQLKELIRKLDVVALYGPLDAPGHAVFPPVLNGAAVVFINELLTPKQQKTVLLHELGHIAKQRDEKELYNVAMTMKIKMEYGANRFMIKYLFDKYLVITGDDPYSVNYLEFMRQNDIPSRDENIVKDIITSYQEV